MISLGVIASGLVGGGPPPTPANSDMKLISLVTVLNGVDGGDFPDAHPFIDVDSITCEAIYQKYRVMQGGVQLTCYITAIDGIYAINARGDQYLAITPYYKDAAIKNQLDWESTALNVGVDIDLIDCGTGSSIKQVTLIEPGKFFTHTQVVTGGAGIGRELTAKIVTYTSPTSHSTMDVTIDLDAMAVDADFEFTDDSGIKSVCINVVTGELTAAATFYDEVNDVAGCVCIVIDTATGAITDYEVIAPIDNLYGAVSSLRLQSVIDGDCFERQADFAFYTASKGNTAVNGGPLQRFVYTSRSVDTLTQDTIFSGISGNVYPDFNAIIYTKLAALGFTPNYSVNFDSNNFTPALLL